MARVKPKRTFFSVADMTPEQWELLLEKAKDVVGSIEGLRESIEARERAALYWDHDENIIGLVTIDLREETFMGRNVVAIYTGNAYLREQIRGMNIIQKLAMRCYVEALARWPRHDHFWFFGSNSFRSYMTMTRNFDRCFPHRSHPLPEWEHQYILHLTRAIYGVELPEGSLVHEAKGARAYQEDLAGVPDKLQQDPDIEYYVQLNPNYADGGRLMCLGPLTLSNWAKVAKRAIRRGMGKL